MAVSLSLVSGGWCKQIHYLHFRSLPISGPVFSTCNIEIRLHMLLLLAGDTVASTHFKANSITAPRWPQQGSCAPLSARSLAGNKYRWGAGLSGTAGYRSAVRPALPINPRWPTENTLFYCFSHRTKHFSNRKTINEMNQHYLRNM